MDNWKPFFFESNSFFDWIKNLDDWIKLRQSYPDKNNEELLAAKEATYKGSRTLEERNKNPNYGFRWEHDGARTLGDFFKENNMTLGKYASFNRFELLIPEQAVKDCYHPGDCEDDCKFWVDKVVALNDINPSLIKEELKEYGAWEDNELNDDRQNWIRILWLGAGNIQDDIFETNK